MERHGTRPFNCLDDVGDKGGISRPSQTLSATPLSKINAIIFFIGCHLLNPMVDPLIPPFVMKWFYGRYGDSLSAANHELRVIDEVLLGLKDCKQSMSICL